VPVLPTRVGVSPLRSGGRLVILLPVPMLQTPSRSMIVIGTALLTTRGIEAAALLSPPK
jgi:hypothetical protein